MQPSETEKTFDAETPFSSREHWLRLSLTSEGITGCQCGFTAAESDYGYGDSVVDHIAAVAAAEALAAVSRG